MNKIASIGTVSNATMRNQDLIPSFCAELRYLGHRSKVLTGIEKRVNRALNGQYGERDTYFADEVASFDLESLFNMLEEHAPSYFYFGSHPGDGSDYGFWLSEDIEESFDGLKVDDTSEIPTDYNGEVLHCNDHGNLTLYFAKRGKLNEIWSIV
jgi:hypothetical protein